MPNITTRYAQAGTVGSPINSSNVTLIDASKDFLDTDTFSHPHLRSVVFYGADVDASNYKEIIGIAGISRLEADDATRIHLTNPPFIFNGKDAEYVDIPSGSFYHIALHGSDIPDTTNYNLDSTGLNVILGEDLTVNKDGDAYANDYDSLSVISFAGMDMRQNANIDMLLVHNTMLFLSVPYFSTKLLGSYPLIIQVLSSYQNAAVASINSSSQDWLFAGNVVIQNASDSRRFLTAGAPTEGSNFKVCWFANAHLVNVSLSSIDDAGIDLSVSNYIFDGMSIFNSGEHLSITDRTYAVSQGPVDVFTGTGDNHIAVFGVDFTGGTERTVGAAAGEYYSIRSVDTNSALAVAFPSSNIVTLTAQNVLIPDNHNLIGTGTHPRLTPHPSDILIRTFMMSLRDLEPGTQVAVTTPNEIVSSAFITNAGDIAELAVVWKHTVAGVDSNINTAWTIVAASHKYKPALKEIALEVQQIAGRGATYLPNIKTNLPQEIDTLVTETDIDVVAGYTELESAAKIYDAFKRYLTTDSSHIAEGIKAYSYTPVLSYDGEDTITSLTDVILVPLFDSEATYEVGDYYYDAAANGIQRVMSLSPLTDNLISAGPFTVFLSVMYIYVGTSTPVINFVAPTIQGANLISGTILDDGSDSYLDFSTDLAIQNWEVYSSSADRAAGTNALDSGVRDRSYPFSFAGNTTYYLLLTTSAGDVNLTIVPEAIGATIVTVNTDSWLAVIANSIDVVVDVDLQQVEASLVDLQNTADEIKEDTTSTRYSTSEITPNDTVNIDVAESPSFASNGIQGYLANSYGSITNPSITMQGKTFTIERILLQSDGNVSACTLKFDSITAAETELFKSGANKLRFSKYTPNGASFEVLTSVMFVELGNTFLFPLDVDITGGDYSEFGGKVYIEFLIETDITTISEAVAVNTTADNILTEVTGAVEVDLSGIETAVANVQDTVDDIVDDTIAIRTSTSAITPNDLVNIQVERSPTFGSSGIQGYLANSFGTITNAPITTQQKTFTIERILFQATELASSCTIKFDSMTAAEAALLQTGSNKLRFRKYSVNATPYDVRTDSMQYNGLDEDFTFDLTREITAGDYTSFQNRVFIEVLIDTDLTALLKATAANTSAQQIVTDVEDVQTTADDILTEVSEDVDLSGLDAAVANVQETVNEIVDDTTSIRFNTGAITPNDIVNIQVAQSPQFADTGVQGYLANSYGTISNSSIETQNKSFVIERVLLQSEGNISACTIQFDSMTAEEVALFQSGSNKLRFRKHLINNPTFYDVFTSDMTYHPLDEDFTFDLDSDITGDAYEGLTNRLYIEVLIDTDQTALIEATSVNKKANAIIGAVFTS